MFFGRDTTNILLLTELELGGPHAKDAEDAKGEGASVEKHAGQSRAARAGSFS